MQDEAARWVMDALTRYEAALLRYATTLVGESQAADVVQDTFLELCRANRESVEGHLAAWLFTVCKHRAFDLSRKARRLHSLEEADVNEAPDSGPVSKLERKEAMTRIGAALESLPERERDLLDRRRHRLLQLVRRALLERGTLPDPDSVRRRGELLNYFDYDYARPHDAKPFAVTTEVGPSPWAPERRLVRIGLRGATPARMPPRNLVYLVDVSGSMDQVDKLPRAR